MEILRDANAWRGGLKTKWFNWRRMGEGVWGDEEFDGLNELIVKSDLIKNEVWDDGKRIIKVHPIGERITCPSNTVK